MGSLLHVNLGMGYVSMAILSVLQWLSDIYVSRVMVIGRMHTHLCPMPVFRLLST